MLVVSVVFLGVSLCFLCAINGMFRCVFNEIDSSLTYMKL